jgi:hypothetical protein
MSLATRKHNAYGSRKNWWRRYFWCRDEFWAKHAVHRAAQNTRNAARDGTGRYFFWNRVCLLAAEHCAQRYGPVPALLLRRPIGHDPFSLSSAEVSAWLKVEPPFRRRARLLRTSIDA